MGHNKRGRTFILLGGMSVGLVGCAGNSGGSAATTPAATAVVQTTVVQTTTAVQVTTAVAPSASPNRVTIHATGAYTIDVSGPGGYCDYYIPGDKSGINYGVSSTEFGATGWDLHVQGNSPADSGVLLNTTGTSYANDATTGHGVVNVGADLHHADLDLDLVNVADHSQVAHITGSIDCP